MRYKIKIVAVLFTGLLLAGDDCPNCGTYAANWLNLETGTRAIGMGGAHVAAGDGVYAAPYNPSSISSVEGIDMFFSNTEYVADIRHVVIGYATQLDQNSFVGLHIFYLDSGDIPVTTKPDPLGLGEYYKVKNTSIRGIYSRRLFDRLNIGFSVKYIRETIHTVYMQSFLIDLGSSFSNLYGTDIGFSLSNIGPDVQFHGPGLQYQDDAFPSGSGQQATEPQPVPLSLRLGVKSDIVGGNIQPAIFPSQVSRLSFAMDLVYSQDGQMC